MKRIRRRRGGYRCPSNGSSTTAVAQAVSATLSRTVSGFVTVTTSPLDKQSQTFIQLLTRTDLRDPSTVGPAMAEAPLYLGRGRGRGRDLQVWRAFSSSSFRQHLAGRLL